MKVLADENIPYPLVRALRRYGVYVFWIPETQFRGKSNSELLELAGRWGLILITRDRDFLDMSLRKKSQYGIIYIGEPVRKDNIDMLVSNILKALKHLKSRQLAIVTSAKVEFH
ncbi:MAG: DUF5615 family PIN-like protein [Candidatus Njordarchaeota archaeon]